MWSLVYQPNEPWLYLKYAVHIVHTRAHRMYVERIHAYFLGDLITLYWYTVARSISLVQSHLRFTFGDSIKLHIGQNHGILSWWSYSDNGPEGCWSEATDRGKTIKREKQEMEQMKRRNNVPYSDNQHIQIICKRLILDRVFLAALALTAAGEWWGRTKKEFGCDIECRGDSVPMTLVNRTVVWGACLSIDHIAFISCTG